MTLWTTIAAKSLIGLSFAAALTATALFARPAEAATIHIVALGASNTFGQGVARNAAWPARLEALLRAKGYDVRIANAGINGDDTSRILARTDRDVPDDTQIVILDKAAGNDRRRGIATETNVAAIAAKLQARHIALVMIDDLREWADRKYQDDRVHISAAGHAAVAARLLPRVIAAIGGHKYGS
jgi:acyl-CoA thioesterase-1